jgi:hypothetical protein
MGVDQPNQQPKEKKSTIDSGNHSWLRTENPSKLDNFARCLLFFLSARVRPAKDCFEPLGLLHWLDRHKRNPTLDDLHKFHICVRVRCTGLAIPDTLCTEDSIRAFITQLEPTDLSGVAAVLGGILSQDVLNALGGRELPIKNWLFFDARTCTLFPSATNGRRRKSLQFDERDKRESVIEL